MASRYHPLYDGIWNDDKLEGAPFEELGFFIYLFANSRQRPSGIYRVTDQQIATDVRLSLPKVRKYLVDLQARGQIIIRDGVWLFVRGYFGRQPKQDALLRAVQNDIDDCSSRAILEAFGQKYSHYHRWSADRLATITRPSGNGHPTVVTTMVISEQSSTEINKQNTTRPVVLTDDQFVASLKSNPAYQSLNIDVELAKMDAWLTTRRGRKKTRQFVVNWLNRQDQGLAPKPPRAKTRNPNHFPGCECEACHGR